MLRKYTIIALFAVAAVTCLAAEESKFNLNDSRFGFIENRGQWNENAYFLARAENLNLWLGKDKIFYDVWATHQGVEHILKSGNIVSMEIIGGDFSNIEGVGEKRQKLNFIYGSRRIAGVALYKEALARNVLPGIDVRFYYDGSRLRYDYRVKPGADPRSILLFFNGQNSISVEGRETALETVAGDFVHSKLFAYQIVDGETVEIDCRFKNMTNGFVGFEIGEFDRDRELIIDPLVFSRYFGSPGVEEIRSISRDGQNCVYVAGSTDSPQFPTTEGVYSGIYAGKRDVFVAKFCASGSELIYSTYIGGSDDDQALDIFASEAGYAYVAGATDSEDFPTSENCYSSTLSGEFDVFSLKLSPDGDALEYSTLIGGSVYDEALSIAVGDGGNAYIAGKTYSTDFPSTSGALGEENAGEQDAIICKLSADGSDLIYSTYLGGTRADQVNDIAVDAEGSVYAIGSTRSWNFPVVMGSYDIVFGGGYDAFAVKIKPEGDSLIYSTFLGGSGLDQGSGLAILPNGEAFYAGQTMSSDYPTTINAYERNYNGGFDIFFASLSADGAAVGFSTLLGGSGDEAASSVFVDADGEPGVAGFTNSINYPSTDGAFDEYFNSVQDGIITIFKSGGYALKYSTYFGGDSEDAINSALADSNGCVYFAGKTLSSDLPKSPEIFSEYSGEMDGFIGKIRACNAHEITVDEVPDVACAGYPIDVEYSVNYPFNPSNTFFALLSDALGSFEQADTVGALAATEAGVVKTRLRRDLPGGENYKIRIISTNPPVDPSISTSDAFKVNPAPQTLILSGESEVCRNSSATYSGNFVLNTEAEWQTINGEIAERINDSTIVVDWTTDKNAGFVSYRLLDTTTGCYANYIIKINILSLPSATISGDLEPCSDVPQTYEFETEENVEILSIDISNGEKTGDDPFEAVWDGDVRSGSIILRARNVVTGCENEISQIIQISPSPKVTLNIEKTFCINGEIELVGEASPAGGAFSGLGVDSNGDFNPASAGVGKRHIEYYYETPAGCSGLASDTAVVFDKSMKPFIIQIGEYLQSNYQNGNQWFFNGEIIEGATERAYTPEQGTEGYFQVLVTDFHGCLTDTSDKFHFPHNSVDDENFAKNIKIYPNPTENYINFEIDSDGVSETKIELCDPLGNALIAGDSADSRGKIDVSSLSSGAYYLKIRSGEKYFVELIIVRR